MSDGRSNTRLRGFHNRNYYADGRRRMARTYESYSRPSHYKSRSPARGSKSGRRTSYHGYGGRSSYHNPASLSSKRTCPLGGERYKRGPRLVRHGRGAVYWGLAH